MITLEHTLIMLLLLMGLLNAAPNMLRYARVAVFAAILLAFVAPADPINLPWNWLSALVIPLLLWQIAYRLVGARWVASYRNMVVSILLVLGITMVIILVSGQALSTALLFGLLIATIVFQASEEPGKNSLISMLGPLTLAFLISEIDSLILHPGQYALFFLGSLGLGALLGYLAVLLALQVPRGAARDLVSIGHVYASFIIGLLLGVSSVATAVFSVIIYVAYGVRRGLWEEGRIRPRPLDSPPLYILAAAGLAFFAWQTHVPIEPLLLLEIGLALVVVALVMVVGRLIGSPAFTGERVFPGIVTSAALLIFPAVLLWQPQVSLDPALLAAALFVAGLTMVGAHLVVTPLLGLYLWLDQLEKEALESEEPQETVRTGDLMRREWLSVQPDTPVIDLARMFLQNDAQYALVTDPPGKLVGIVTEADLFVKEERLPRTGRTYMSLFKRPVTPENFMQAFTATAKEHKVADIMTSQIFYVRENSGIGRAIREMINNGIEFLPVVSMNAEEDERIVGIITRTDIIRSLTSVRYAGDFHPVKTIPDS